MEFDKTKSCKGCPDRQPFPNCHGTCKGYLDRVSKQRKNTQLANRYIYGTEGDWYIKERSVKIKAEQSRRKKK